MVPKTPFALFLLCLLWIPGVQGDEVPDAPATVVPDFAAQREAADDRFRRLMAEGRHDEATAAAVEVVTLTRRLHGDDSVELASPLVNLATAALRSGNFKEAEANYQVAIGLIEKHEGFLSLRLANPLVGLGEVYIRTGDYTLATAAYERALRVNHVNEGFYNPAQFRIRDGLTEGYLGLKDLEKANFHQEAVVHVQQRRLGRDDPGMVPVLTKLGRWYDRSNQSEAARFTYQKATRLVEKVSGDDSADIVAPLLAIAGTYRQQALLPQPPDSTQSPATLLPLSSMMLRKALGIVEQQEPPDPAARAGILVQLGDLYLMWGKPDTAAERYQEAWQALSTDEELVVRRDELFAQPARLMGPAPPDVFPVPSRKSRPPDPKDLEQGYVVVRFDVNERGQVSGTTVIEANPANLLERRVAEAAGSALFRPRYVDGVPVPTTGLILRHEFRYAPATPRDEAGKDGQPAERDSKPLPEPGSSPAA